MNRYLKFRCWDKAYGGMLLHLTHLNFDGGVYSATFLSSRGDEKTIPIEGLEIMQFTGLTDKNGNPVFEGDIVKAFGKYVFKVIFLDGSFLLESEHQRRWLFDCVESLEVVGNIYQDNYLLEAPQ